ncbi:hypothetical protein CEP52_014410 [Fusarium oligoseptatum]|uniref:Uncharacterized protein n=1 Tax=Fusarium oligoseptatum TaxID=2604345 RepID=A0A428SMA9_9HYPO|nr:hypothetical protein CEP52_014410 [Fusarium oligoseptatum]
MSRNSTNNTVARGTTPKETNQSSAQGAASNTNDGANSTNVGHPRNHTRRSDPRDLIIIEASDNTPKEEPVMVHRTRPRGRPVSPNDLAHIDLSNLTPQEEPVMVSREEVIDDEWIKEFPKDNQKEADNAQGSRE